MANITFRSSEGKEYAPESSIGHLQLLFALLQFGKQRYVDPAAFILSLGLDTSTQQDAQVRFYWQDIQVSDSRTKRLNTVNTKAWHSTWSQAGLISA
jgi:hypothetical protein